MADAAMKDVEAKEETTPEVKENAPAEEGKDASMEDTGGDEAAKPKAPEKPKELEEDAPEDNRPRLDTPLRFFTDDTTVNLLPSAEGQILTSPSDGGCQHLLAGARTNVGLKAGRYLFEAVIIQQRGGGNNQNQQPPQSVVRVGFAESSGPLLLAAAEGHVCFDTEGVFVSGRSRKRVSQKIGVDQVIGVLLNLDPASPNANTISLFRNGTRMCQPQPLPENIKGKALFPAVSFTGATLRINFGPAPLHVLPFKCTTVAAAAKADCEVNAKVTPAGGKHEVVFPVALPDEGGYDWVDSFVGSNKGHVELSNREIQRWAKRSGLVQKQTQTPGRNSNDKPDMSFGVNGLENGGAMKMFASLSSLFPRNYVVQKVEDNLLAGARKTNLSRYPATHFKRVAVVAMGEPSEEFKTHVQGVILAEKKKKAEAEAKRKKAEADRKKALEAKKQASDKKEEAKVEEDAAQEEVHVELTEDEKKTWFRKGLPDMLANDLTKSFANFSIPTKEEGFDEIRFVWQKESGCEEHFKAWMKSRKASQRVEDLKPGAWFTEKWAEWKKAEGEWRKKHTEWKKVLGQLNQWKKEGKKKDAEDKKEGEDDKPELIDAESVNVHEVEDICDIGGGQPLFANYGYEDWTLLSLRFELHLLAHAFKKDLDDPERPDFHEKHLAFYYNKYFKKAFDPKMFGKDKNADVVGMIKDAVTISENGMLSSELPDDSPFENFVKVTEDQRRDRQRRMDAGDETAEIKFKRPQPAGAPPRPGQQGTYRREEPWNRSGGQSRPSGSQQGGGRPYSGGGSSYGQQKRPYEQPVRGSAAYGSSSKAPRYSDRGRR